jgi:hypothetical protein
MEISMKKLTYILLLTCLFIPAFSFAYPQHFVAIPWGPQKFIYLVYTPFQKIFTETDYYRHYNIFPLTCTFSTLYEGKINIRFNDVSKGGGYDIRTNITKGKPFKYFFHKPSYVSLVDFYNMGCDSGWDGDKCIKAKNKHLDNVTVDCY